MGGMDRWYLLSLSLSTKTMRAAIRRAENWESRAFLRKRSPSVLSDYSSTHTLLPATVGERGSKEKRPETGCCAQMLHFTVRPHDGQLEEQLTLKISHHAEFNSQIVLKLDTQRWCNYYILYKRSWCKRIQSVLSLQCVIIYYWLHILAHWQRKMATQIKPKGTIPAKKVQSL